MSFIESCESYDGGISLIPGQESHGGSLYTALAALALMGRLEVRFLTVYLSSSRVLTCGAVYIGTMPCTVLESNRHCVLCVFHTLFLLPSLSPTHWSTDCAPVLIAIPSSGSFALVLCSRPCLFLPKPQTKTFQRHFWTPRLLGQQNRRRGRREV